MKKDDPKCPLDESREAAMSPIYSFSELGYMFYGEDSGALFDDFDKQKKLGSMTL